MPLSSTEQQTIKDMVAAASPGQRDNMRLDAEAALTKINNLMTQRHLSQEETKVAERAIEILVRFEAGKGKGRWFRSKRRLQLTQMYLGGAVSL